MVSTTRAACHLLHVLLESQLIETSISVNLLEDTLFGSGNSGPSSLTDTSLILMRGILRSKILDSEKRFESLCLKIVGWLKSRWSLRRSAARVGCSEMLTLWKLPILIDFTTHMLSPMSGLSCCTRFSGPFAEFLTPPYRLKTGVRLIHCINKQLWPPPIEISCHICCQWTCVLMRLEYVTTLHLAS